MNPSAEKPDDGPFVRAFVAVELDEPSRQALAAALDRLRKTEAHVAWVPARNLHVSLVFLGDTPRTLVETIGLALDEAAVAVAPFSYEVADVGTFGNPRAPRVIWAGVAPCPPLMTLQSRMAASFKALGLPLDEREFRPHVTLGRVRSPRGADRLKRALSEVAGQRFGQVRADSVALMRSRLAPGGAEYTLLHRAACGGTAAEGRR